MNDFMNFYSCSGIWQFADRLRSGGSEPTSRGDRVQRGWLSFCTAQSVTSLLTLFFTGSTAFASSPCRSTGRALGRCRPRMHSNTIEDDPLDAT